MCKRTPHLPPRFPKAQAAKGVPGTQKTGTVAIPPDLPSRSFEPAVSEQPCRSPRAGAPPAPATLEYYINRLPGECRDRRWFPPPGGIASVPCDRPADRRHPDPRSAKKTPRSFPTSQGSSWQPFPPSYGPKAGKRSAPGGFRHRAVPRASHVLHPRPSRKHPPELACRSGRFGSGGSSSLPIQSHSTQPDFQKM